MKMRIQFPVFGFVIAASFGSIVFAARPELDENWESYKLKFEKLYADATEEAHRRESWESNFDLIQQHNEEYLQGLHTYSLGENPYADLSHEEFVEALLSPWSVEPIALPHAPVFASTTPLKDLPQKVDWRDKNVVTPVKDQKQCGSCWAFAATGSLEGMHAIATGKLVSLSEQNLVDCAWDQGNMGCGGGFPDWGFQYIIDNKGIDTEKSYPYEAQDGRCRFNAANVGATITNFTMIRTGADDDLLKAVAEVGPIAVGMDASSYSFQLYKTGIYKPKVCSKTELDHGILAVGYGEDDKGGKYWIVKNSWGTDWGLDGYFLMDRDETNECGISTRSSFPSV